MSKRLISPLRAALRLGLTLALLALPFELASGLAVGPLTFTNVELLLLGTLGLWLALLAAERRAPHVPQWLVIGSAAFVGALLLSALLAPAERAGALKFALRQAQGALLALCVADSLGQRRGDEARRPAALLAWPMLAGAGLSAAFGLAELSEAPAVMAALAPFKTETSYMGGLLRLSASFSYANTAAQFYEALLPLAVLLAAGTLARELPQREQRGLTMRLLALALPALLLLATLYTYSRAALAVSSLLLLATPLAAWWSLGRATGVRTSAISAGLAAVGLALVVASPTFRVRIAAPDVSNWYSARYTSSQVAPMAPNELRSVPITVRNDGRIRWEPGGLRPVRLSYHWLDATGRIVRFEGRRTQLPHPVEPGASVTLQASVQAPSAAGRYVLVWDMLREQIGRGWFSQMGVPPARVPVEVGGAPAPNTPPPPPDGPASAATIAPQPAPPGRSALWGVALELWRERPLLGIGPDVFRQIYGERLGLARFDRRVHTNNLYLELLTGAGVLGLGVFLALAGACLWRGTRSLLVPPAHPQVLGAADRHLLLGALLGVGAVLIHGLLDVFLAFTPTYALFWLLVGAVAGLAPSRAIDSTITLRRF